MMFGTDIEDYIEKASNECGKIVRTYYAPDGCYTIDECIAKWQYHPNSCTGKTADVTIVDEGIRRFEDMPVNGTISVVDGSIRIGYFNDPAPKIDKIKVNPAKNATTVLWTDGTATVVRRSEDDPDDLYFAVASAMAIKFYGSNSQFKKVINEKTEYYESKKKHE